MAKQPLYIKQFICMRNAEHIEPWRYGEEDVRPLPFRPCKICGDPMSLIRKKWDKDKKAYVIYNRPVRTLPSVGTVKKLPSTPSLKKFVKHLGNRYTIRAEESKTAGWVIRKDEKAEKVKGLKTTFTERSIYVDITDGKALCHLHGVVGWVEDVRVAARRTHLFLCAKFMPRNRFIKKPTRQGVKHGR